MRKPPEIQTRALRHMRQAQAFGWNQRHLICDYAAAALEAQGHDADNATRAVEVCWARNFSIADPI